MLQLQEGGADISSNAANFFETIKSKRVHEPQKSAKTFLQDDCGKIIKRLLNHLATIILRGIVL
jgi:hypothetical protein